MNLIGFINCNKPVLNIKPEKSIRQTGKNHLKKRGLISDLAEATAFLTRLPVPERLFYQEHSGSDASWAFPLAAVLAVLPSAALLLLISTIGGSTALSVFLALCLYVLVTGALHEDGLADCADGLFGGKSKENVLAIMKDSRIGTYGVLALVFSVGLRLIALSHLAGSSGTGFAVGALICGASAGRALMLAHWSFIPPAKKDGAAAALGQPVLSTLLSGLFAPFLLLALLAVLTNSIPAVSLAVLASGVAAFMFSRFANRRIGGHTGDTLGATAQIGECVFLATLAIFL